MLRIGAPYPDTEGDARSRPSQHIVQRRCLLHAEARALSGETLVLTRLF